MALELELSGRWKILKGASLWTSLLVRLISTAACSLRSAIHTQSGVLLDSKHYSKHLKNIHSVFSSLCSVENLGFFFSNVRIDNWIEGEREFEEMVIAKPERDFSYCFSSHFSHSEFSKSFILSTTRRKRTKASTRKQKSWIGQNVFDSFVVTPKPSPLVFTRKTRY